MSPIPAFALSDNPRSAMCVMKPDFNAIERFIRDNKESKAKVQIGIDLLVRTMAMFIKGAAQEKSMGAVAPRRRSNPALAYRLPVQRITGAYFAGWMVRKMAFGRYLVYNDSKEAYLIEYGLYMRTRRPVLKMSLISMLNFLQATRTEQRFLDSLIKPRRDAGGRYANVSLSTRLQGTSTLGGMAGPQGYLP